MFDQTSDFVKEKFLEYYSHCFDESRIPHLFEKREFGALLFEGNVMIRHRRFSTGGELTRFLCSTIPSDVYYSSAYYDQPDASEMGLKGWVGADLIFDIDADHIPTPCGKVHDEWTCGTCGFVGKGLTPDECPVCHGQKFSVKTWPCETCLDSAKVETTKLLDILRRDFGFSEKEVHVFFSGHRGYHVHVENDAIKTLDAVARKEIVDYVCGVGLDIGFLNSGGSKLNASSLRHAPQLGDSGWRGRLARSMYDFVLKAQQEDYKSLGLRKDIIETIMRNKSKILKSWNDLSPYRAVKDVGLETWKKIAEYSAKSSSANVDTVVTTDIHRLIRLAETLHGKTGLKKVEFEASHIEIFDPFKDAVAFKKGSATVSVSDAPEFKLCNQTFGPYKNQKVELPTAAALLLICKDRAEIEK